MRPDAGYTRDRAERSYRRERPLFGDVYEAGLVGEQTSWARAQLHHPADVCLRLRRADDQALGDLSVGEPDCDERHHLPLALGQVLEALRGRWRPGCATDSQTSRLVTLGASGASPSATTRTADRSSSMRPDERRRPRRTQRRAMR